RQRLKARLKIAWLADQHDRAFEFALVLLELLILLRVNQHDRRFKWLIKSRRPGARICVEDDRVRLDHLNRKSLDRPAAPERAPRFQVRVAQAPGGERLASPLIGVPTAGRAG